MYVTLFFIWHKTYKYEHVSRNYLSSVCKSYDWGPDSVSWQFSQKTWWWCICTIIQCQGCCGFFQINFCWLAIYYIFVNPSKYSCNIISLKTLPSLRLRVPTECYCFILFEVDQILGNDSNYFPTENDGIFKCLDTECTPATNGTLESQGRH